MGRRVRVLAGLGALAEVVVFVLVAGWIGLGWTLLAAAATTVLGAVLLARQGTRALAELRERMKDPAAPRSGPVPGRPPGRALGDAGLVAAGGLLMVLPGFLGDLVGLLCLLPPTRPLVRALLGRSLASRLPVALRGPVPVRSSRVEGVPSAARPYRAGPFGATASRRAGRGPVIEGEVIEGEVIEGEVVEGEVVEGEVAREEPFPHTPR
ncbi:FxsA family protein [Geodermatophilus sp. TF02-6]|uniref:FxsA family protein n=1 Tax=Geodermatophilus sp. TF02-6 TaxID=2250575 RepID=UPI000DE9ADD8|nr:FxsA family protein [Geodermatophilus sp. TF02-6]RBY78742.1 FxsA family protein [Geodermatophilus sp. TF02-6]